MSEKKRMTFKREILCEEVIVVKARSKNDGYDLALAFERSEVDEGSLEYRSIEEIQATGGFVYVGEAPTAD